MTELFDTENQKLSILKYYLGDPLILCLGDVNNLCVDRTGGPYEVVTEETNTITVQCLVDATPPADKYVWEKVIMGGNATKVLTEDHSFVKVFIIVSLIRRYLPANCLSVFDHFVGLAIKGLTKN